MNICIMSYTTVTMLDLTDQLKVFSWIITLSWMITGCKMQNGRTESANSIFCKFAKPGCSCPIILFLRFCNSLFNEIVKYPWHVCCLFESCADAPLRQSCGAAAVFPRGEKTPTAQICTLDQRYPFPAANKSPFPPFSVFLFLFSFLSVQSSTLRNVWLWRRYPTCATRQVCDYSE